MTPRQLLREADACERRGDPLAAVGHLREAIGATRETARLANRLGDLLSRAGQDDQAAAAWARAAGLYEREGFQHKALAVWRKVLRATPDDPVAGRRLADLYAALGHVVEAAAAYRRVADQWLARGERDDAIRALERRSAIASDVESRALLGRLYADDGRRMLAIGQFLALADELDRQGRREEAADVLSQGFQVVPDSGRIRAALADEMTRTGRAADAVKLLEDSPEPLSPRARIILAEALVGAGRGGEARARLEAWLAEHEDDHAARAALARTLAACGDADGALVQARQVLGARAATDHAAAVTLLEQLLERSPEHVATLLELSAVHRRGRHRRELAATLERLARVHERQGQPALAEAVRDLGRRRGELPRGGAPPIASDLPPEEAVRLLDEAAREIASATAVVIAAGGELDVEFGATSWSDDEALWQIFPPYRTQGLSWGDLARADLFERDPALAWGFFAARLRRARAEPAHDGLRRLMRWRALAPAGGFVVTSTVEGRFQRAGLGQDRIVECRGSLEWIQCARECGAPLQPADDALPEVDGATGRATGSLPTCRGCGAPARPNVFLLGDTAWDMTRVSRQDERLQAWLARFSEGSGMRLVVLECGETPRLPTLRLYVRRLVRDTGARIVRISDEDTSVPDGGLSLPMDLRAGLSGIEERLRGTRAG